MKIQFIEQKETKKEKIRVAAYVRVSDERRTLGHSLEAQREYYEERIRSQKGWCMAGVYADGGISGTTERRPAFQRLLEDARAHRIDLILTKSISRFSRNAVQLLGTIRELKALGVEIRFEREGISTMSSDGEFMLSLLATFAEAESKSISDNVKWGIRHNFRKGIGNQFLLYGYRWDGTKFRIVPEEAAVVRRIFRNYLEGKSAETTEREFREERIPGPKGGHFSTATIRRILENERYTGNRLLQKEFIAGNETRKRRKNMGELPRFFVRKAHPAIIETAVFLEVQRRIGAKRELRSDTRGRAENPVLRMLAERERRS